MDIKDYLPLYIGCACDTGGGFEVQLTVTLLERAIRNEFKPILRKLQDMTEEEEEEWFGIANNIKVCNELVLLKEAARTFYLLSKKFDLFKLIENGLAIDRRNNK